MKKCKHLNGRYIEIMSATHERIVSKGIMDKIGFNEVGNIEKYVYWCKECDKYFNVGLKNPVWLQKIVDQLGNEQ